MAITFDRAVSVVLTLSTLAALGILVRREAQSTAQPVAAHALPQYQSEWRGALTSGLRFGSVRGPLQLVVFTDLECPFCRRFHQTVLPRFLESFPDSVGWTLVHYPLPMHRFAKPAARAVECASKHDSAMAALVDLLYSKQDSLGLKSWASFGSEGGVQDTSAFAQCIMSTNGFERIDSGLALAARLGVRGTPGIMLNGWLFDSPPSESALKSAANVLLASGNQIPKALPPSR